MKYPHCFYMQPPPQKSSYPLLQSINLPTKSIQNRSSQNRKDPHPSNHRNLNIYLQSNSTLNCQGEKRQFQRWPSWVVPTLGNPPSSTPSPLRTWPKPVKRQGELSKSTISVSTRLNRDQDLNKTVICRHWDISSICRGMATPRHRMRWWPNGRRIRRTFSSIGSKKGISSGSMSSSMLGGAWMSSIVPFLGGSMRPSAIIQWFSPRPMLWGRPRL